ncbi:MAG: TonB family protein [Verrucomicrobiales bacterium]|nr:TonB family protein [Verrucomicrobiales bacterium]
MNRSHQKCLIASSGAHLLLFVIFAFGSAFFLSKPPTDSLPKMKFMPSILIDEMLAGGGGNPKLPQDESEAAAGSSPPIAVPPQEELAPPVSTTSIPQPVAPPPPVEPVDPPKLEKVETPPVTKPRPTPPKRIETKVATKPEIKPDPKLDKPKVTPEPAESTKPTLKNSQPEIDLTKVITRSNDDAKRKQREAEKRAAAVAEAERKAQEEAYGRAKAAAEQRRTALESSLQTLGTGFSTDKGVKIDVGGPGGQAYGNYALTVKQRYEAAWRVAATLNEDDRKAEISVTVLRNGTILNARITRRSGLSAMDRSIESVLRDVKQLPPFPENARDEQRTFVIEFNLQAKRRSG